jgi:tripartite-type tricarboxylate transporter receptor subunit TctC
MKFFLASILFFIQSMAYAWQPSQTVNVYIGAGPGTTAEIALRRITDDINKRTGVSFNYHHRPGPGQVEVTNNFLNMPRDGHHILMPFFGDVFVWSEIIYKDRVKWNIDSFEYIIGLPSDPAVIVAPIDSPINSPRDLIQFLGSTRKNINFGTATGTQAIPYHAIVHFSKADRSKVKEIRYKAAREVMMDVASQNLDFGVIPAGLIKTAEGTGKVKIIGITSDLPFKNFPQYKTFNTEIQNLVFYIYRLVVLPPGTKPEIVTWFNNQMKISLENPDIIKSFEDNFETIEKNYLTPAGIKRIIHQAKLLYQPLAEKAISN